MPTRFNHVYIESAGSFLPGTPIGNADMDAYIAPLNRISSRIKARILAENGIQQRHYAIDTEGRTTISHAQMAAAAVRDCLGHSQTNIADISLLSVGSSGGDALMDTPATAEEIARKAMAIAAEICVYTNTNVIVEQLESVK